MNKIIKDYISKNVVIGIDGGTNPFYVGTLVRYDNDFIEINPGYVIISRELIPESISDFLDKKDSLPDCGVLIPKNRVTAIRNIYGALEMLAQIKKEEASR